MRLFYQTFAFFLLWSPAFAVQERQFKDEWAIVLAPDTTPAEFAARHDLVHLGEIAGIGVHLFHFKTDHHSKGPWKTARQKAFESLLSSQEHKSVGSAPSMEPRRDSKRGFLHSDDSGIVWFQQQELRQRVKRSVEDPLFPQQWHLQPSNAEHVGIEVFGAWEKGYHGEGIVIAICDDGLDIEHPDIRSNFNRDGSFNFNKNIADIGPNSLREDWHGTSSGGMAAARDDGTTCGVGAAYRAQLTAVVILQFAQISDADEARALSYRTDINHIYSNSWGPTDDAARKEGPKPLTEAAVEWAIKNGRNGLGSVYVWSSGNGHHRADNCNYDGYASWRYTIAVGAVDFEGNHTWYSEPCAALHFVAPSSGSGRAPRQFQFVISSDLMGERGFEAGNCNTRFAGTSAACPLAAGIIALVLQARPDLNWIELQQVLIDSTIQNAPGDADWYRNAAGRLVSHKYGFGLINATKAVVTAENFSQRIPLNESVVTGTNNGTFTFGRTTEGWGAKSHVTIQAQILIRHVEVYLSASTSTKIGDLRVVLLAPSGTPSVLAERHSDQSTEYRQWRFTSLRCWGEKSTGTWTVIVTDTTTGNSRGKISEVTLKLYGGEPILDAPSKRTRSGPPDDSSPVSTLVPQIATATMATLLFGAAVALLAILVVWGTYFRLTGKYSRGFVAVLFLWVVTLILLVQAIYLGEHVYIQYNIQP